MLIFVTVGSKCVFEALQENECPANRDISECSADMAHGGLCEADGPLPDGNTNYNINNCGRYDLFKCNKHISGIYLFTESCFLYNLLNDIKMTI